MKTLRGVSSIVLMVSFALLCFSPGPEAALLFSPPIDYSTSPPTYMTKGDFNNDSITDIVVTSWTDNNMTVFLGDGAGGFTALSPRTVAPGTHPNKIVTGYFNSDSNLDVAIALGIPRTIIIFFGDGDGNFTGSNTIDAGDDSDANALVSGFFDGDSTADIAVAKDSGYVEVPDHVRIFSGDGAGSFTSFPSTPPTGETPYYIITADFNSDTKADLAIANLSGNSVTILLGNGDGSFTEAAGSPVAVGTNPATIFAADFNKDTIVDLAVANFGSSTVSVLLGNGSGGFSEAAGSPLSAGSGTVGVTSADLNLDGNADLAVTNSYDGTVSVFEGNGDGTFKTGQDFNAGAQPGDLISADFNGDGRPDLAFVRSGNMSVLINNPQCFQPPPGMVSWWGGDNNALDMVGGNNGTLMGGATYAPGIVGQAFSLAGTGDYVDAGTSDDFNFSNGTGDFTIDAWINIAHFSTWDSTIITKATMNPFTGWSFYVYSDGRLAFGGAGVWELTSAAGAITTGSWFHVAVTKSGGTYKLLKNGVEVASGFFGNLQTSSASLTIGTDFSGVNQYGDNVDLRFNGLIDEVEVFSRTLGTAEIAAIYNAGSAGKCRSCATPPSDMVSWWKGENDALDIVGTNNGTLINDATYAPGKVGQAFSLDGEDDHILVPHSASLDIIGAITMDAWFKLDELADSGIIIKGDASGTINLSSYSLGVFSDGKIYIGLYYGDTYDPYVSTDSLVSADQWYHVAATWDGTTTNPDNVKLYLNGRLIQKWDKTTPLNSTAEPVTIGSMQGDTYYHSLKGLIDEVKIYNRALSAEEIAAAYNAGSAGVCANSYIITVTPPAGNGAISCPGSVLHGYPLVCTITPDTGYYLSGLVDNAVPVDIAGSVINGTYTIPNVTEAHTVEATFSEYMIRRIRVLSSDYYSNLLTEAFGEVEDNDTVMLRKEGSFTGSAYDRPGVSITLKGGYNSTFGSNTDQHSTISGLFTISSGTVTVEYVTIQ